MFRRLTRVRSTLSAQRCVRAVTFVACPHEPPSSSSPVDLATGENLGSKAIRAKCRGVVDTYIESMPYEYPRDAEWTYIQGQLKTALALAKTDAEHRATLIRIQEDCAALCHSTMDIDTDDIRDTLGGTIAGLVLYYVVVVGINPFLLSPEELIHWNIPVTIFGVSFCVYLSKKAGVPAKARGKIMEIYGDLDEVWKGN